MMGGEGGVGCPALHGYFYEAAQQPDEVRTNMEKRKNAGLSRSVFISIIAWEYSSAPLLELSNKK